MKRIASFSSNTTVSNKIAKYDYSCHYCVTPVSNESVPCDTCNEQFCHSCKLSYNCFCQRSIMHKCNSDTISCERCDIYLCIDCLEWCAYYCLKCNSYYCDNCLIPVGCGGCGEEFCEQHYNELAECYCCSEKFCDNCAPEFIYCENCKAQICNSCSGNVLPACLRCDNHSVEICDGCRYCSNCELVLPLQVASEDLIKTRLLQCIESNNYSDILIK
jgi:hypothetical protein